MEAFRNKEIVLVNQDSGYLMIDIANAFTEEGFSVTLLTGRLVIRNKDLHKTVKVRKIAKYNRKSNLTRVFTWTIAFLQIVFLVKFKYRNSSLMIVTNPPIGIFLPLFVRNKYSLLIFDVFPDAIAEMGYLSPNSLVVKRWEKLNRKIYGKADKILTITDGMRDIVKKYAGNRKIEVISLWSDNSFLRPVRPEQNPFILINRLSGKFIVMYSGNIGATQGLEIVVEIAKRTTNRCDIVFLIVGDGVMRSRLDELIKKEELLNCIMMPWQDPVNIPYSFAASNLAVVSLGKLASSLAIPSKLYNFLSVGSPILGLTEPGSELGKMIHTLNVGKCFNPVDIESIISFICSLADDKAIFNEYCANSVKAARQFTPDNAKKIISCFSN